MTNIFNASKQVRPALEISGRSACGRMCDYCPQTEFNSAYKKIDPENKRLTLDQIVLMQKNIPVDTVIHWTGYVEPLELKEFSKIVSYLNKKGYSQLLGTTLTGHDDNINFVIKNFTMFDAGISLHLPDNEGLMKGRFDNVYADNVEQLLRALQGNKLAIKVSIALIGESFHKNILRIVEQYKYEFQVSKTRALSSRSGLIDINKFGYKITNNLKKVDGPYYCSIQRLNQGVLLPNGLVSLCCQDFGLNLILGSLVETNLEKLYSRIETEVVLREDFKTGIMEPCAKCEYYLPYASNTTLYKKLVKCIPLPIRNYLNKLRIRNSI
jgi:sulfatase maturation enzyme AslB (radical SAM superfamily)